MESEEWGGWRQLGDDVGVLLCGVFFCLYVRERQSEFGLRWETEWWSQNSTTHWCVYMAFVRGESFFQSWFLGWFWNLKETCVSVCWCVCVLVCVCVCARVFPPERNDGRASSLCVLGRRPGFIVIGSVPESCVGIGSMRHQS